MNDFEYTATTTVEDAVQLLAARGEGAKILAGGTDILVQLREGQRDADLVVDIKKIPLLREIAFDSASGLKLGAAVPCCDIYDHADVAAAYPALADASRIIGGWQIQSRACIGGNLCNSSPAADGIPPLIVYDVTCHIVGPEGSRTLPVAEFCTAPGRNVLGPGEILTTLEFPAPAANSAAAYQRFIPRNEMDIAVVGTASWVQLDSAGKTIESARIALAAVAPTPVFADEASAWLAGQPATEETFVRAGELARSSATPISDMRGTAEYRTHLVGILTQRTLAIAVERARSA